MSFSTPFRSFSSEQLNLQSPHHDQPLRTTGSLWPSVTPSRDEGHRGRTWGVPGKSVSLGSGNLYPNLPSTSSTPGGGRTVKDYDAGFKELKKENFNLKLRIYFLEERLKAGSQKFTSSSDDKTGEEMNQIDLKVQVESLKQELSEKSELLRDAGIALQDLEDQISALTVAQSGGGGPRTPLSRTTEDLSVVGRRFGELSFSSDRDDDESLIKEVDEEIARGVLSPVVTRTPNHRGLANSLLLPLESRSPDLAIMGRVEPPSPTQIMLDAVQETDSEMMVAKVQDLETQVEEVSEKLASREEELKSSQGELEQRLKDIIALESELVNRNIKISSLEDEVSHKEIEISKRDASFADEREDLVQREEDLRSKLHDAETSILELEEEKESLVKELEAKATVSKGPASQHCSVEATTTGSSNFTIHTHKVSDLSSATAPASQHLQVVTQSISIPSERTSDAIGVVTTPSRQRYIKGGQFDQLRSHLKTSFQERKYLLRKIGTLAKKVQESRPLGGLKLVRKDSEADSSETDESSIPFDSIGNEDWISDANHNLDDLNEKLDLLNQIEKELEESRRQVENLDQTVLALQSQARSEVSLGDLESFSESSHRRTFRRHHHNRSSTHAKYRVPPFTFKAKLSDEPSRNASRLSEDDSWSEPDVNASRKRMGISLASLGQRSEAGEMHEIIQCPMENSGSLNCLLGDVKNLYVVMSRLGYELDLTESFDSGRGSDDEDSDYMGALQEIIFNACDICAKIVAKEVELCLTKCGQLILDSSFTLRRLRLICCSSMSKYEKATEKLALQNNLVSQLEDSVKHLQVTNDLLKKERTKVIEDLCRKTRELHELQSKLNENYKLVAELSNENLRLGNEKMKALESVENLSIEQTKLRSELRGIRKTIVGVSKATGGAARLPGPPKHIDLRKPPSDHQLSHSVSGHDHHKHGGTSTTSSSMGRKYPSMSLSTRFYLQQQQQHQQQSQRSPSKLHRRDYDAKVRVGEEPIPPTTTTKSQDISSPDLGVDFSSDSVSPGERMRYMSDSRTVNPSGPN